ncbi:MAG: YhbY family RNA-binding protein [Thermoanaerobaculia bacterium]
MPLSARQRQYLKGLAHDLAPVVRIGKARITPEVAAETDRSLEAHELIKVRIEIEGSDSRRSVADDLADRTASDVVARIGKIAIFYRAREEKPAIRLP